MGLVYQKNKKTGITYVYENKAYWDKEKKQSRAKRILIGKLDPETNEVIKTRAYKRNNNVNLEKKLKQGPVPVKKIKRSHYGATYLFDQIGKITGVTEDLKSCFPTNYNQLLSIAYYLILEENNSLSRFSHWQRLHVHPFGEDIPSQRSSELFQSIEEENRMFFFKKQGRRRIEKEYWAFDTTSISSYSETLNQVKKGKNKENDRLPQINLALLFGEESGLPFYYRKLPGNISDVKTVKQLMQEFKVMGYEKVNVIFDRGFYSKSNIDELFKSHRKFLIGVKLGLKYVEKVLEEEKSDIKRWSNFETQFGVYGLCKTIDWNYEQVRPYKNDVLKEKRRAYIHLFYDPEKASKEETDFNNHLTTLRNEIQNRNLKSYHLKDYEKYLKIKETPKRGIKITPKEDAIIDATRNFGYFVLLSNGVNSPFEALALYQIGRAHV